MRTLSGAFSTAINNASTTLGWLLSIEMPDGTSKRFNSFGEPSFEFPASSGDFWSGFPGFNISSMSETSTQAAPTVEIARGLSDQGLITFTEAVSGLVSGAPVDLYIVDYNTLASHIVGSKWRIGDITTTSGGAASFEIVCLERRSKQLILNVYSPGCKHQLGDSGCGVNMASYTDSATVSSSPDGSTVIVTGPSRADDYFNNGAIKFTSGPNNGLSYDVRDFVGATNTIKLATALKRPAENGNTCTIHAGCDKSTGANGCARFSNINRRFAFDHLPDETLNVDQVVEVPPQPATTTAGAGRRLL